MKKRFQSKKRTTQPCQWGVNIDYEKSPRNCLYNGIDIYTYIMMAHNIKILFLYEIFDYKMLMSYKL